MHLLPWWGQSYPLANTVTKKKIAQETVDGAHALVVLTKWDEFKTYPQGHTTFAYDR